MKKTLSLCLSGLAALAFAGPLTGRPKLVVAIAVDQFRYDYLTRYRSEYSAGLKRLLTQGAVFTNARYQHFPTVTAIGHSTFLTGATPSMSGIIGNEWYERESSAIVTSVSDDATTIVGGRGGKGSSPRRLLVSTLGDELKIVSPGSRIIGVSLKDRAAILPAGHMADGAYWFDNKSGRFVSSSYYFAQPPSWVVDFNQVHPGDHFAGMKWLDHTMPSDPQKLYESLAASPFGNELVESFAERALQSAQLGTRDTTDVLTVSFSSNDYAGHRFGPDSAEVHEMCIRTDKLLGKFFDFLDARVGAGNYLLAFTSDHGVAPLPQTNEARKMPGGRLPAATVRDAIEKGLAGKFGAGSWVRAFVEQSAYLNQDLIAEKKLDPAEVERTAAQAAMKVPHVFRVFTRTEMLRGAAMEEQVARLVQNGFYPRRSADVVVLLEPYWLMTTPTSTTGTNHSTTFSYDAHVPVILMGPGISAGRYYANITPNDIAPTLATMLDVETPSGSVGRVLGEILQK